VDMDILSSFLEECCVENPGYKVQSGKFYKAYLEWCKNNGEQSMSRIALSRKIKERGFTNNTGTGGYVYWAGVGLAN